MGASAHETPMTSKTFAHPMDAIRAAIEPLLAVSTVHLTRSTVEWISSGGLQSANYPNEYGAFIWVPDDGADDELPEDLAALFAVARGFGIVWLKLDQDAREFVGLESYEATWDSTINPSPQTQP